MSERPASEHGDEQAVAPGVAPEPELDSQGFNGGEVVTDEVIESLRGLVEFLVEHLVDEPQSVQTSLERRNGAVHVQLRMPEEELGKVIGRGGRIAKSLRTVLLVAGSRHNVRVTLDIES